MSKKQQEALALASQKKQQEALARTEKAISRLLETRQKITVRSVAREAGVSVSYLYKYPELSYKIQGLREQQKYDLVEAKKTINTTEFELENQQLRAEIKELKSYIEKLAKQGGTVKKLQLENLQLQTANQELKQQLAHAQKNLQETRDFILSQGYQIQKKLK